MIIEIPDGNSIIKWKFKDNENWNSSELSDLIMEYDKLKNKWLNMGETIACGYCSNCEEYVLSTHYNFCPNCGADMRGKEE